MRNLMYSSISASGLKGDVAPSDSLLPTYLPQPVLWFSAESVNLDGSGFIDSFINKGSGGPSILATFTSSKATVGILNSKQIIDIPETSNGGYSFPAQANIRTVLGLSKYGDGLRSTFSSYDGYFSGSFQATGDAGKSTWYNGQPNAPIDNGVVVANRSVVLPLNNRTIGARLTNGGTVTHLFRDDDGSSRNWFGTSGDIMFFDVALSDSELLALHNSYMEYYGLA